MHVCVCTVFVCECMRVCVRVCVVCGVWCVVCGVWCVVCGVWCVVCGVCLPCYKISSSSSIPDTVSHGDTSQDLQKSATCYRPHLSDMRCIMETENEQKQWYQCLKTTLKHFS